MSTSPTSSSKRRAWRSLEPPRKLTTAEYVTKITQSVLIDVFVGPENKHFSLPKDLLCHHSPVLEVMLSGQFKEGKEHVVTLPKDLPENFEVLQDFIVKGNVLEILSVKRWGSMTVERCISFLVYANKYMLGPVEDHVHEPLKRALISCEETVFSGTHIKRVFEATENGSSLRVLITDAALSFGGAREGRYQEQETEVAGFAAEMLQQMRNCILRVRWRDPLRVPKPGEEPERYD